MFAWSQVAPAVNTHKVHARRDAQENCHVSFLHRHSTWLHKALRDAYTHSAYIRHGRDYRETVLTNVTEIFLSIVKHKWMVLILLSALFVLLTVSVWPIQMQIDTMRCAHPTEISRTSLLAVTRLLTGTTALIVAMPKLLMQAIPLRVVRIWEKCDVAEWEYGKKGKTTKPSSKMKASALTSYNSKPTESRYRTWCLVHPKLHRVYVSFFLSSSRSKVRHASCTYNCCCRNTHSCKEARLRMG